MKFSSRNHTKAQRHEGERKKYIFASSCLSVKNIERIYFVFFLAVILLLGCSRSAEKAPEETTEIILADFAGEATQDFQAEEQLPVTLQVPIPRFVLGSASARPGEIVSIGAANSPELQKLNAVLLDSRGRRISRASFFSLSEGAVYKAAILAIPSTALIGNATIRIESDDVLIEELSFIIDNREFYSETIALNQVNTDLRTVPDPQKDAESELLWAIISRTGTEVYSIESFMEPFMPPVTSTRRTSSYGSRRVYQYADGNTGTTIHAGVDYGVPTGTEVSACGAAKVVLARERIVTGNTVILEHLPGIYSLYYHMDSIAVSEGSVIDRGVILGKSGATGLATGPHLHWEIRVFTENADPDTFLARPVLDKNDIINKLMTNAE